MYNDGWKIAACPVNGPALWASWRGVARVSWTREGHRAGSMPGVYSSGMRFSQSSVLVLVLAVSGLLAPVQGLVCEAFCIPAPATHCHEAVDNAAGGTASVSVWLGSAHDCHQGPQLAQAVVSGSLAKHAIASHGTPVVVARVSHTLLSAPPPALVAHAPPLGRIVPLRI